MPMMLADRIRDRVRELPDEYQREVLDFVEYLATKIEPDGEEEDRYAWSTFSLASALRDMEDEPGITYTEADMIETFE